jgi:hypothetical protein
MEKKIALAVNNVFMVTVLDFAHTLLIVEIDHKTVQKGSIKISDALPSLRAHRLKTLQIDTVLCGAVSDPLSMLLWHYSIELFSGLAGNADSVLNAFIKGELPRFHAPDFRPGFRGRGRFRNRRRFRCGGNAL